MSCQSCGAVLDPAALSCPYCQAPTPAAAIAHQREMQAAEAHAQREAAARWQAEAAARARLETVAKQSVLWSVVGVFLCCLPLGVVGIVQGVRARGLAAEARVAVPASAQAGLWVGILSCVMSIVFLTWASVRSDRLEDQAHARIAVLEGETRAGATAPALDAKTACGLAEIYALQNGFDGQSGHDLSVFECAGKLSGGADRAALEAFRFHYGSTKTDEATVCFERGTKWFVRQLTKDACPGAPPPASAAPPATPAPARPAAPAPTHDRPNPRR